MSEIEGRPAFGKMRLATAIDAARDAIAQVEAEGQDRLAAFLRAARAAAALVGDNEGGIIAGKLLGLVVDDGPMPQRGDE